MNNLEEELTIEDIVNLKSTCSKKVFDNFIERKFSNQIKSKTKNEDVIKEKKKTKADLEFENVFGCERSKSNSKSTIDKRFLVKEDENETEQIVGKDRPDEISTKFRPSKFREIFKKVDDSVSKVIILLIFIKYYLSSFESLS